MHNETCLEPGHTTAWLVGVRQGVDEPRRSQARLSKSRQVFIDPDQACQRFIRQRSPRQKLETSSDSCRRRLEVRGCTAAQVQVSVMAMIP
ncbi:hypothetical protein Acr_14g0006840 [Actinidia rufa]|uniref:Uncharacterized protein n=1 Tax=Actinidia rufa TaxID=165716 RepID=A0A7J0FQP7_9ERIC|nr:hypothetical protein Acr_14g0006840 [Actinidia rufa]